MAVTSIWRVNGWLGKVVVYVENPEKTANPEFYENEDMMERECQGLDDIIAYAINSRKTEQHKEDSDVLEHFVSGVNCHPATARAEMLSVKKRFGKEDGTIAYHGYQSFAPAKPPRRWPTRSVWSWHNGYGEIGIRWWLPPIWIRQTIFIVILC